MATSKSNNLFKKENRVAFLFILIPLIGFFVFTIGAMAFSFIYSFQKINSRNGVTSFIGFENYKTLFTNELFSTNFFNCIKNTLVMLLSIPFQMLLGIIFAAILHKGEIKGSKLFQILYYMPAVSSAVALNIVWRYIFNNEFGVLNYILGRKIYWIGDNTLIKVAIIFKNSINGMGGALIMYLAGMLSVPKDYYEAADIDGASKIRQFFTITLPLITPMTFYLLITGLISGLQSYADSQIFGAGVEGAQTIVYFIWNRGINQNRYGLASAASLILALAIMLITLVQFKFSNKWVYED